jgi:hypothetical protein
VFEVLEFSDDTNTQLEENAEDEDEEQQRRLEENAGDEDEEQQRRAEGGHPDVVHQLAELEAQLTEAFGDLPILRLPVLFDNFTNVDRDTRKTTAFTPDLANLRVVGDRLLVPRPFGPRTAPANAVAVLRDVASAMRDVDASAFTVQRLHARGLDRTTQWVRDAFMLGSGGNDAARLADAFLDGFPNGKAADVRTAIIRANPGAFLPNGDLRPGWRKLTIPERTVDVFEAWTDAVASSLGLRVEWVDAWYYHVRLGSIHCGTNVIRRPTTTLSSPWWRLPAPTSAPAAPNAAPS